MSNVLTHPSALPARRLPARALRELVNEAEAIAANTRKGIAAMLGEVAALSPDLKQEARDRKAAALAQTLVNAASGAIARLRAIGGELAAQAAHYTRAAIRSRYLFRDADPIANATIGTYWHARVASAPDAELPELARLAASEGWPAVLECVAREASRRKLDADAKAATVGLADRVPLPSEDVSAAELIVQGQELCEQVEAEIYEAAAGGGDPGQKIARALGVSARRRRVARELGSPEAPYPPAA